MSVVNGFNEEPRVYGPPSSMEPQLIDFYWQRKSLIDLRKDMYFGQLADTTNMP